MGTCINLEPLCAEYGMKMVQRGETINDTKHTDWENVINRALGVLAENGFYAMNVYLLSISKTNLNKYGLEVYDVLLSLLGDKRLGLITPGKKGIAALADIRCITEDLPKLVLARRVTEQSLTFARYHCKAYGKAGK